PWRGAARPHSGPGRHAGPRAETLRHASIFVPAMEGGQRLGLEAAAAGAAPADPPGVEAQPELAAAAVARLAENDQLLAKLGGEARDRAEDQRVEVVAAELDGLYRSLTRRRRPRAGRDPRAGRPRPTADQHLPPPWTAD